MVRLRLDAENRSGCRLEGQKQVIAYKNESFVLQKKSEKKKTRGKKILHKMSPQVKKKKIIAFRYLFLIIMVCACE